MTCLTALWRKALPTLLFMASIPVAAMAEEKHIPHTLDGLTDSNGMQFSDASTSGKLRLIYFGYPTCRIICTRSGTEIAAALRALDNKDLMPIFITRPNSDGSAYTREELRSWPHNIIIWSQQSQRDSAKKLHDDFDFPGQINAVFLTGPHERLEKLAAAFRATVGADKIHSPYVYVMDEQDRLLMLVRPEELQDKLLDLLQGRASEPDAPQP